MFLNGTGINVDQAIAIYGIQGSSAPITANGPSGGTIEGHQSTIFGTTTVTVVFSGYINSTVTNQTVNYLYNFTNAASVLSNDTGLVISASTTSFTITSPDNATAYSGVLVISGS